MTGSTAGIVVICVVVVVALVAWLVIMFRAARHPGQEHPKREPMRGLVQGGQHVGGGRSVAPTRDAPVPEGGGNPPSVEEEDRASQASRSQSGQQPRNSGSPMDLLAGRRAGKPRRAHDSQAPATAGQSGRRRSIRCFEPR
jgi:hypothetical protein